MLKVIFGRKGEGKTKRIIALANEGVEQAKGNTIFIDDDSRYMFDIKHQIRFIDASEYAIDSPKMFYGFISGLIAQDYDLEKIYIDGFLKIVRHELDQLEEFFTHIDDIAHKFGVEITISVSGSDRPAYLDKYVLD
ncbi:hypothetical protein LJB83_01830 [Clostridia bacterium OttesenSCG-928-F22]|nr:hypothetical protein [Clostridia bacterium OttesenSCG-928-F22]